MAHRVFRRLGAPAEPAEDGAHALRLVSERGLDYFDVVLLDNQMPTMGGEQTARALRALGFTGMIVGMTGDPRGAPERTAFERAGLDECIDKDTPSVARITELIEGFALPAAEGLGSGGGGGDDDTAASGSSSSCISAEPGSYY